MRKGTGRGAKVLPAPPNDAQKASFESLSLSSVDTSAFMEGLRQNDGNALHSTAIEDDLNVLEKSQMNNNGVGRTTIPKISKGKMKPRPDKVAVKQKGVMTATAGKSHVEKKFDKTSKPTSAAKNTKALVGKTPTRRSIQQVSSASPLRPVKKNKDKTTRTESDSGSSDPQSQEDSDSNTAVRNRRSKPLSSDDEEDELKDEDYKPSPKKARLHKKGQRSLSGGTKSRRSSSGSASAGPEKTSSDKRKKKRHSGTELEVMLEAFLDFCDKYRDSMESNVIKKSIEHFSKNVEEQLQEKITSNKELKVLKRENAKVDSLIRTETHRLLDAKNKLMSAERQLGLLQKEETQLKLRLSDLQRSQSFLQDIAELNRGYLDYRKTHPRQKETYGASSLPALLLQTKHIQAAEHQLRTINDKLEKRLKEK